MKTRREFLLQAGVTSAAMSLPWANVAIAQQQLPRRPIPGTEETLPVIGLGNARVFLEGEMSTARELMEILRDHGGSYMDCIFNARTTSLMIGTCGTRSSGMALLFALYSG